MISNQTISLANKCNLSCTYCWYETDSSIYPLEQLSACEYERWFENCSKQVNLKNAFLTGGEPTLNKELPVILEKTNYFFENTVLMTNGTTICRDKELLESIKHTDTKVHVSLDHTSLNLKDQVRGGTKLSILGVQKLIEYEIPTQITMVLTSRNYTDIFPTLNFCKDNSLFLEINIVSVPASHPLSILSLEFNERKTISDFIKDNIKILGRPAYYSQVRRYLTDGKINRLNTCKAAMQGVFIESNGDVVVCAQRGKDILGNIKNTSLNDILRAQEKVLRHAPGGPCVSLDCLTIV